MISGKLTVRYTTFYRTGRKFRDQRRGAICVKNRQPSQHQFHCCVEPRGLRGVEAFSFGRDVSKGKESGRKVGLEPISKASRAVPHVDIYLIRPGRFKRFRVRSFFPPNTHVPTSLAPLRKERVRAPLCSFTQKYQSADRRRIYNPRRTRRTKDL